VYNAENDIRRDGGVRFLFTVEVSESGVFSFSRATESMDMYSVLGEVAIDDVREGGVGDMVVKFRGSSRRVRFVETIGEGGYARGRFARSRKTGVSGIDGLKEFECVAGEEVTACVASEDIFVMC
jgi:hypothetical protein